MQLNTTLPTHAQMHQHQHTGVVVTVENSRAAYRPIRWAFLSVPSHAVATLSRTVLS